MPTHFRWLWYLVGLAGMALAVVGVFGILGSAWDIGILIPVVVGGAIVIGYALVRFRRSLNAAVAAAPSRQPGATPPNEASGADVPIGGDDEPGGNPAITPRSAKPSANPGRTSRR